MYPIIPKSAISRKYETKSGIFGYCATLLGYRLLVPQFLSGISYFRYNQTSNEIGTKILQGAGTVEQILARFVNHSILMPLNEEKPESLNFYLPLTSVLPDNEIMILEKNAKVRRSAQEESKDGSENFYMTVDAINFQMTFWIGFSTIEEAQSYREEIKL